MRIYNKREKFYPQGMGRKALLIDQSRDSREALLLALRDRNYHVTSVSDLPAARKYQPDSFDLILTDTPFEAKPRTLLLPLQSLNDLDEKPTVIASSPQMKEVIEKIHKVAQAEANVFISGESGTGKEVVASLIHTLSKRQQHPFVKVNCAALPETLIESEFFGHEKGAYTGAHTQRIGRFEKANRGSLLLDEITEIPLNVQAKLLRVAQEMEFERVGSNHPRSIDVRLISTSNRPMTKAIEEKTFRSDLFYRLSVVPIHLPPLRERPEDILPLAHHFLTIASKRNGLPTPILSATQESSLLSYPFPGNVRELANLMEQLTVLDELTLPLRKTTSFALRDIEHAHIQKVLAHFKGHRNKTAKALGISVRTLRNKLKDVFFHPDVGKGSF